MTKSYENYNVGHPCYYQYGGPVPPLGVIRIQARYTALMEFREKDTNDLLVFTTGIDTALAIKNPTKRRDAFLKERAVLLKKLWEHDIPRFKAVRRELSVWLKTGVDKSDRFSTPYQSMSLKHSHLTWYFRNLWFIKLCLDESKQNDLFGF